MEKNLMNEVFVDDKKGNGKMWLLIIMLLLTFVLVVYFIYDKFISSKNVDNRPKVSRVFVDEFCDFESGNKTCDFYLTLNDKNVDIELSLAEEKAEYNLTDELILKINDKEAERIYWPIFSLTSFDDLVVVTEKSFSDDPSAPYPSIINQNGKILLDLNSVINEEDYLLFEDGFYYEESEDFIVRDNKVFITVSRNRLEQFFGFKCNFREGNNGGDEFVDVTEANYSFYKDRVAFIEYELTSTNGGENIYMEKVQEFRFGEKLSLQDCIDEQRERECILNNGDECY